MRFIFFYQLIGILFFSLNCQNVVAGQVVIQREYERILDHFNLPKVGENTRVADLFIRYVQRQPPNANYAIKEIYIHFAFENGIEVLDEEKSKLILYHQNGAGTTKTSVKILNSDVITLIEYLKNSEVLSLPMMQGNTSFPELVFSVGWSSENYIEIHYKEYHSLIFRRGDGAYVITKLREIIKKMENP